MSCFFFDGHSLTVDLYSFAKIGESPKNQFRSQLLEPKRDTRVLSMGRALFFWVEEVFSFVFLETSFEVQLGELCNKCVRGDFFLDFFESKSRFELWKSSDFIAPSS